MKYLLILLLASQVQARDFSQVMKDLNSKLNPKVEGEIGFQVGMRTEADGFTWINISKVVYQCRYEVKNILNKGVITTSNEMSCKLRGTTEGMKYTLFQIMCDNKSYMQCKKLFKEQVTPGLINTIVSSGLYEVYLK